MNLENKFKDVAAEFGGEEKAAIVLGITLPEIKAAMQGENEKVKARLEVVFETREKIQTHYTPKQLGTINQFEHLIAQVGGAQKASDLVGQAASTISAVRNGKYKGNTEKVIKDLQAYFDVKAEKQTRTAATYTKVDYAPTQISLNIYETIRAVHVNGGCGIITGDPGVGKTKTIAKYADDNPGKCVIITGSFYDGGKNAALQLLADELGLSDERPGKLKRAILEKLHDGMVIIVDEAQTLSFRAMDGLRAFSDYFEHRHQTLGIVFVGNHCLRDQFKGKFAESRSQLWSRFWQKPRYFAQDIPLEDMALLFPVLAEENRVAELKFLHSIAITSSEGLRTASILFSNAYYMGDYSLKGLAKEARHMDVELKDLALILRKLEGGVA